MKYKKSILIVDDEVNIVRALSRLLKGIFSTVFTAYDGQSALSIIDTEDISMVISDMRMPHMNGYEFLTIVKERKPHAIRLIYSGYADRDMMIRSIVDGVAKSYLMKPMSNEDMIKRIDNTFSLYDELHNVGIGDLINTVQHIPSPSKLYQKFIVAVKGGKSFDEIADTLSHDPDITTKILKIVNSSWIGVQTASIRQAVRFLGLESLKSIVISTEIYKSNRFDPTMNEILTLYSEHGLLSSYLFHKIFNVLHGQRVPDEYHSLGLLHDIGIILLLHYKPEKKELFFSTNTPEEELFDVTHELLSALLLDWWNLPTSIIEACLYHHTPMKENILNKDAVLALHIAGVISWNHIFKSYKRKYSLDQSIFEEIPLAKEELHEHCEHFIIQYRI